MWSRSKQQSVHDPQDNPPSVSVVLCSWCKERAPLCMDVLQIDWQPDMTSVLTITPLTQEMCV